MLVYADAFDEMQHVVAHFSQFSGQTLTVIPDLLLTSGLEFRLGYSMVIGLMPVTSFSSRNQNTGKVMCFRIILVLF